MIHLDDLKLCSFKRHCEGCDHGQVQAFNLNFSTWQATKISMGIAVDCDSCNVSVDSHQPDGAQHFLTHFAIFISYNLVSQSPIVVGI